MHPALRPARSDDVDRIHQLVVDLATYERAADQVRATPEQLRRALFGPSPAVHALVAEVDGVVVGFALWFLSFSTWEGVHGVYLEDLYVEPAHRGRGLGRALLAALAETALARGWARVEWSVLDWNAPALGFYRALGAVAMDGWTVHRLTGDALRAVAGAQDGARNRLS
ncbi:GNAT family N-acetyltransferase [Microlunatus capsulatus]|uniref:GNAT superfamily N-acetyltransferase n=1 Tax=Microlunatus capsulatus TaxID=99117 RepID=A0ABS4Z8Q6_9ACTN|nr:GNAT family N-acetyltransferase [Microlunatus capsulatus]MBP2416608.1 GNAT superfamily N-acetyltransferase [Microlunatus capsulatus]